MQQRDLTLQPRFGLSDPFPHLREHRIAGGLGGHADENTSGSEPGGENLGRQQRRLGLALPHRRFDHEQPGAGHAPRDVDDHRLRRTRVLTEPVTERLGTGNSTRPPPAVQAQVVPRTRRTSPGPIDPRARQRIQAFEHGRVAGEPVGHHDQPGELQLHRTARHLRRFHVRDGTVAELLGEDPQQRFLRLGPGTVTVQRTRLGRPQIEVSEPGERAVMPGDQRPHPVELLRRPPRPRQEATQEHRPGLVVSPPSP